MQEAAAARQRGSISMQHTSHLPDNQMRGLVRYSRYLIFSPHHRAKTSLGFQHGNASWAIQRAVSQASSQKIYGDRLDLSVISPRSINMFRLLSLFFRISAKERLLRRDLVQTVPREGGDTSMRGKAAILPLAVLRISILVGVISVTCSGCSINKGLERSYI